MKSFFIATLFSLSSFSALADYGLINCTNSEGKTIQLSLDSTSDVKVSTTRLLLNNKSATISQLSVSQTDYGILSIIAQVGNGPSKYSYSFNNLGSSKCFGVYGSKQKGSAYVEVINSMGLIGRLKCKCDQD